MELIPTMDENNVPTTVATMSSQGGLYVCVRGLDIENFIKSPLIYSVSFVDFGGIGTLFEEISPSKPPYGDGSVSPTNQTHGVTN